MCVCVYRGNKWTMVQSQSVFDLCQPGLQPAGSFKLMSLLISSYFRKLDVYFTVWIIPLTLFISLWLFVAIQAWLCFQFWQLDMRMYHNTKETFATLQNKCFVLLCCFYTNSTQSNWLCITIWTSIVTKTLQKYWQTWNIMSNFFNRGHTHNVSPDAEVPTVPVHT